MDKNVISTVQGAVQLLQCNVQCKAQSTIFWSDLSCPVLSCDSQAVSAFWNSNFMVLFWVDFRFQPPKCAILLRWNDLHREIIQNILMRDLGKGEAERGVGMKNDPSSRFLLDSICNRCVGLASEWGLNYFLLTLGRDYFRLQEILQCQKTWYTLLSWKVHCLDYIWWWWCWWCWTWQRWWCAR